ncbi:M48 family metallopeptidase [Halobaculum roseum]|uniref:M48 family metallopeptidase n=1 Tax=Halobaculum roseum TaxID=2175149 RepID=A0ABD5MTY5_9EURY|nr:M48 family metalloprotease [Halobaculum roseum]QZY01449.1 peptidase [Halobaculum roseum]
MVPLQSAVASSTPDLGPPVVFWVLLCLLGAVVGAVGSALARRLSNPVGKYRLLYVGAVLPLGVLAYGLLSILDLGAAVRAALVGGSTGTVAVDVFLSEFLTMSAAGTVALVAYAPTVRGVRAVRDIDLSTGRAVALMARWLLGASGVFALAFTPFRLELGAGTSTVAVAVGLVALVVGVLAASPWFVGALRSTREPAGDDAARIDRLRERAGVGSGLVDEVRVLDTDDEETANAFVRGIGPTRRLFVTSTFLDALDDETAAALLAVQAGRVRSRALSRRMGAVIGAAVPLLTAFSGSGGPNGSLVAVAGVALVGGLWYARRGILAADDRAAESVGADAVADALERYAEVHAMEPSRRRVPNPLSANVALGDRIDRLRERAREGGEAADAPNA